MRMSNFVESGTCCRLSDDVIGCSFRSKHAL
jgi:hypothetical protein